MTEKKQYYNRHERKRIEKALGLKKPTNDKERREYTTRKIEAGKQLHKQFTEAVLNNQAKAAAEKESEMMKSLMADKLDNKGNIIRKGMTYEEARDFIIRNYEIERKRAEKLAKREEKRRQKEQEINK